MNEALLDLAESVHPFFLQDRKCEVLQYKGTGGNWDLRFQQISRHSISIRTRKKKTLNILGKMKQCATAVTLREALSDRFPGLWTWEGGLVGGPLIMSGLMRASHMRLNRKYPGTGAMSGHFR
jgi:hypothetical protein